MARSISTDPYHTFRFGVRFDGQIPMGFCTVSIRPNGAHPGPGKVVMSTALMPLIMEFLGQRKRAALDILAFHISDEFGVNGKPSMTFRLHGVQPCLARLNPIEWDATGKEILMTEMTLDYERLKMIQDGIPMSQPIPRPRAHAHPMVVM